MRHRLLLPSLLLLATGLTAPLAPSAPATGPLRPLVTNPRWFTDGSGRAILLAGSHTWANLQDAPVILPGATSDPPPVFDYDAYLATLARHHHNFFRLWRWEVTSWSDKFTGLNRKYATPHPWLRSGPGHANDGKPKFDLERFNAAYFERLRARVDAARRQGMYTAVMLFEGWAIQFSDGWEHHPFHAPNNRHGLEADANGDGRGIEFNTLVETDAGRRVLALQQAYVRQVVDTVNDLDNVLYEIVNEAGPYSTAWQYAMINYVKEYQAAKPKQHPVGMTFQFRGGTNAAHEASPADWISPNQGEATRSYWTNPCADCSKKIIVSDTDHMGGHTVGDNLWVWKTFTRGHNLLLMEDMTPSPTWQDSARVAMGQVRRWAGRMNLAAMTPQEKLTPTRYCLAATGREYLVFQHDKGEFTVDLKDAPGPFAAEWFDINRDRTIPAKSVQGGAVRTFSTPFPGPAALYLRVAP
jgi:hypothetical protein